MSLLQPIGMETAYFKGGAHGGEGSGKTTTTFLTMLGIHKMIDSKKPIAVFDSEGGMSFMAKLARIAKVELVGCRSLAFKDLADTIKDVEQAGIECMVIDSITHPWREIVWAYKQGNKIEQMSFNDWAPLKDDWRNYFSTPYVASKIHIWMCGRSGAIFEDVEVERKGRTFRQSQKTGTRMATEGETGYEPSLLVEFTRNQKAVRGGDSRYVRQATVIKDRAFALDGVTTEFHAPRKKDGTVDFERLVEENLPFKFFWPHIETLNLGGSHKSVGISTHTVNMYADPAGEAMSKRRRDVDLVLEQIPDVVSKHFPGSSALEKKAKGDIIEAVFGSRTWAVVQRLPLEQLQEGYHALSWLLEVFDRSILVAALGAGIEDGKVANANAAIDELRQALQMRHAKPNLDNDEDLDEVFGKRAPAAAEPAAPGDAPTLADAVDAVQPAPQDPEPRAARRRTQAVS